MSFISVFFVMGMIVLCLVPLPFLMKRPTKKDMEATSMMH
jgi:preprotein translocase subunit YajC